MFVANKRTIFQSAISALALFLSWLNVFSHFYSIHVNMRVARKLISFSSNTRLLH